MPQLDGEIQTQNNGEDNVVKRILEKLPEEETTQETTDQKVETETDIEVDEVETKTEGDEELEEERIITAKDAKDLGLPPSFIGKPLSEAGKSYKEVVKWENKNNQEIKQLKAMLEELRPFITKEHIDKAEVEADEEIDDDMPDPYTEKAAYKKWLADRDRRRDELTAKKVLEQVKNLPSLKTAEQIALKQQEKATIDLIKDALPDGVDVIAEINKWAKEHEDSLQSLTESNYYQNNPKKLAEDVINWYKANSYDSLKSEKENDIKKQVHKKTVENLKAKGDKTKTNLSSNPRIENNLNTAVGRILANLEQSVAAKNSP